MSPGKDGSKGFLHATDAAIASLILALYTLTTIAAPPGTELEMNNLRSSSQDIMWVMSDLGLIDYTMKSGNDGPLRGLVAVMNNDLDFKIMARDFPPSIVKIGVVASNVETENFATNEVTDVSTLGSQIPDSESGYAQGTMQGYGNYSFVLYDGRRDNNSRYTHVVFDFNGNDIYQEHGEGPFHFRSQFICGSVSGPPGCDGDDIYEVGSFQKPVDEHLTIYPSRFSNEIEGSYNLNDLNTLFSVDTVNVEFEPDISNYDVVIVQGVDEGYLNNHSDTFNDYLDESGSIIELNNLTTLDDFHSQLGLWQVDYPVSGASGNKYSSFYQVDNVSSSSHYLAKFFYGSPLHVNFYRTATRTNGNLSNGWNVTSSMSSNNGVFMTATADLSGVRGYLLLANRTSTGDYDTLYMSNSTNFAGSDTTYNKSNRLVDVSGFPSDYRFLDIDYLATQDAWRLTLTPKRPYHFRNYGQNRLVSGQPFLHMSGYDYDVSGDTWVWDYDFDLNNWLHTSGSGVPEFNCGGDTHKRGESLTTSLPSSVSSIVLTDVNAPSLGENCDEEYEYLQFDLDGDDSYNTTPREIIYKQNDSLSLNNKTYRVDFDNDTLSLVPITPPAVETAVYTGNVRGKHGDYVNFPVDKFDPDDTSLLRSIIVAAASRKIHVTSPRSSAETEIGVSYLGAIESTNTTEYLPYSLSSSWWYQ